MLWYDLATDNTKESSWYNPTEYITISYLNDGRTITKNDDSNTWRYFFYNSNEISTVKIGDIYTIPNGTVIEFEVTAITGSVVFDIMDNRNNHMDNQGTTATGHYKIVLDGTDCKMYKDGATTPYATKTMNGSNVRLGFVMNAYNESITYKNFIIYSI